MRVSSNQDKKETLAFLRQMVGNKKAEFRPGQWEAIEAVVNKSQKTIVVERTGWGKSFVYFAATKLNRSKDKGMTILISPLLALMRNQCEQASRCGVCCKTINSSNPSEWESIKSQVLSDAVDILIISPERLSNPDFMETVLYPIAPRIALLVVDEVHCISDWGHDFRPDYKKIANVIENLPEGTPLLGTTATANNRVIQDIKKLLAEDVFIQRGNLMRETLALDTIVIHDQASRLAWLTVELSKLAGSGIIYTATKKDADLVAEWLSLEGYVAAAYHSRKNNREELEEKLTKNELKVLVATSALGMGYDKPDISFVIHYQSPGNVIAYYQQVGRAGRAIDKALGILLSGEEDGKIQKYFRENAYPSRKDMTNILEALEKHEGLSSTELQNFVNLSKGKIEHILKCLHNEQPAPVTKVNKEWRRTPVRFKYDQARINALIDQRELEWLEMNDYIATSDCKMLFLANALDAKQKKPCGRCSSCKGKHLLSQKINEAKKHKAEEFLTHRYLSFGSKKMVPKGALETYRFTYNNCLLKELRHERGWIYSDWGVGKKGLLVEKQKHDDHFGDELLEGFVEMVKRKITRGEIKWVTCVPSEKHPTLVPDFAKRVANELGVPFVDVLKKSKKIEPQKLQQNSYHRVRNLDGAFKIKQTVPKGSVLLVDDIYDSGWTFCIVSALLRQEFMANNNVINGEPAKVYPVALASTSDNG